MSIIIKLLGLTCFVLLAKMSSACDIIGATGCPHQPESALKNEDFFEYCSQYRWHFECVFEKYKGCDQGGKHANAMKSMIKGLNNKIRKIQTRCGIDFEIPIPDENAEPTKSTPLTTKKVKLNRRRKRPTTTTTTITTTPELTTTTTQTTTTSEPCEIDTIPTDCHPLLPNIEFTSKMKLTLPNLPRYEEYTKSWSSQTQKRWCNAASPYFNCVHMRLFNCHNNIRYAQTLVYYTKIKDYVETEAENNCAGGIGGCIMNPSDYRCRASVKLANVGNVNSGTVQIKHLELSIKLITFVLALSTLF